MNSLTDMLIAMFMVMFWILRFVIAFASETTGDFGGFIVFDKTIEIILLFVTVLCFALITRKSIFGGILYLGTYGYYFGRYIITNIQNLSDLSIIQNVAIATMGVLLALFAFLNIIIGKMSRKGHTDSRTGWFFDNKETDRTSDDRSDKNQYKFY